MAQHLVPWGGLGQEHMEVEGFGKGQCAEVEAPEAKPATAAATAAAHLGGLGGASQGGQLVTEGINM